MNGWLIQKTKGSYYIMNKIVGGLLVKNEADRWLVEFLNSFSQICDKIIILDDCSTDNTVDICKDYGEMYLSQCSYWEHREWMQRKTLFGLCCSKAELNDWILILDADEIVNNASTIRKFILSLDKEFQGYALKLYDMWDNEHYRNDQYWKAHKSFWQMAMRKQDITYTWNKSRLHCGRLPLESVSSTHVIAHDINNYIKHMGWSTDKDRKIKYDRYMRIDGGGHYGWLDQYKSILDKNPNLVKLRGAL